MNKKLICATPIAIAAALSLYACGGSEIGDPDITAIKNVVVIYAENRSFDNLYGNFPGANGLQNVSAANSTQVDRDGSPLATLPQVWNGLTQTGVTPAVTQAMTANLPNSPFAIDDPNGFNMPITATTRDLYHRFYENQMQINGGKNDKFAAWADSGGLVMGHYSLDADKLPLWKIAQQYTLADNFFMGAFGGSFLNHQWLICACTPVYPNADKSPAATSISSVESDGVTLRVASNSPASALTGIPKFVLSGNLTPDFYAVNTMQPPYQPSGNKAASGGAKAYRRPAERREGVVGVVRRCVGRGGVGGTVRHVERRLRREPDGTEFPAAPPAVQLLRRPGARHDEPHAAPARWRPGRFRVHQGDRCRHAAAGVVLQAAGQPERARGLHRCRARRSAHCRSDLASAEEPAVEEYARRRDL
jgi:hypothetical protein